MSRSGRTATAARSGTKPSGSTLILPPKPETFLGWLQRRMGEINPATVKPIALHPSSADHVIGSADDDDFRRLVGLRESVMTEVNELMRALGRDEPRLRDMTGPDHDPGTCEKCLRHSEVFHAKRRFDALEKILWTEVGARLDKKGAADLFVGSSAGLCLGVRSDWKIILSPARAGENTEGPFGIPLGPEQLAEILGMNGGFGGVGVPPGVRVVRIGMPMNGGRGSDLSEFLAAMGRG